MDEFFQEIRVTDWLNPYLCVPGKTRCSDLKDILMTVVVRSTLNCIDAPNNLLQYNYHRVYSRM